MIEEIIDDQFTVNPNQKIEVKPNEPILARIISLLLHPLLMASYGVALLFLYTDFYYIFAGQIVRFMIPVVLLSCVLPASCILTLRSLGIISSLDLEKKEERTLPMVLTFISYALLYFYFYRAGLYAWFLAILIAPLFLFAIGGLINFKWKISAHMIGIGCLIGSVLSICYNIKGINPYFLFIILLTLAGCLGVSRLVLKRHTPAQVYAGFLLGLVVSYLCIWIGGTYPYWYLFFKLNF